MALPLMGRPLRKDLIPPLGTLISSSMDLPMQVGDQAPRTGMK